MPEYIHALPEYEFSKWRAFIFEHGFASDRIEYLLSQIAFLLGVRFGIKDCKFEDFTIDGRKNVAKSDKMLDKKGKRSMFAGLDGKIVRR